MCIILRKGEKRGQAAFFGNGDVPLKLDLSSPPYEKAACPLFSKLIL